MRSVEGALVSVVIPAYGHADLILHALESVFAQTFTDYEVIVVNDGSPDHTGEVLRPLAEAARIRYFERPNRGVAAARNFGIEMAKGQFIALLDDDDVWPPDKLEWQVAAMVDRNLVAVGGSKGGIGANGELLCGNTTGEWKELCFDDFFDGNPFFSPGQVMFRKDAVNGKLFDEEIWGVDDLDGWMELALCGKFMRKDEIALYYRFHAGNASKNEEKMLVNSVKVLRKRLKAADENRREELSCRGYLWLYEYLGRRMLWQVRMAILSKNPRIGKGVHLGGLLFRIFSTRLVGNRELRRRVVLDLKHIFLIDPLTQISGRK